MPEVTVPTYSFRPGTSISYGLSYAQLTKAHLDRLMAKPAYVFVSGSLAKTHPEQVSTLRDELGD